MIETAPAWFTSQHQQVIDLVADGLFVQQKSRVRGMDLRQQMAGSDRNSKRQLVSQVVPEFLFREGTAQDDWYMLSPIGALNCKHSSVVRALAANLRGFVVATFTQDPDGLGFTWSDVKRHVRVDRRELVDADLEPVIFVLFCLGAWGGGGSKTTSASETTKTHWLWNRPPATALELLLDTPDTDQVFLSVHNQLIRRTQPPKESEGTPMPRPLRLELRSILFMDLAGWSGLSNLQISQYIQKALPKLGSKIENFKSLNLNTWGDALVATFASPVDAAECALDIRDMFRRTSEADGVPLGLVPRISLHVGTTIIAENPLLGRDDIFGDAVHLAARLEPVTTKGQVFCTEEMAKALEAAKGQGPVSHPMGEVELPKGFGRVKVFAVTGPNEQAPTSPARSVGPQRAPAAFPSAGPSSRMAAPRKVTTKDASSDSTSPPERSDADVSAGTPDDSLFERAKARLASKTETCRKAKKTIEPTDWPFIPALIKLSIRPAPPDNTAFKSVPKADLMVELEQTKKVTEGQISNFAKLEYLEADSDGFSLGGHATIFAELAWEIVRELNTADPEQIAEVFEQFLK